MSWDQMCKDVCYIVSKSLAIHRYSSASTRYLKYINRCCCNPNVFCNVDSTSGLQQQSSQPASVNTPELSTTNDAISRSRPYRNSPFGHSTEDSTVHSSTYSTSRCTGNHPVGVNSRVRWGLHCSSDGWPMKRKQIPRPYALRNIDSINDAPPSTHSL